MLQNSKWTIREQEIEKAYEKFEFIRTQMSFFEGKLLTLMEASYPDKEQREAIKSLVKEKVREQSNFLIELLVNEETGKNLLSKTVKG